MVMDLAVAVPRLLLPSPDLLTSPTGEAHPLVQDDSIRLIAWKLSGNALQREAFLTTLPLSSSPQLIKYKGCIPNRLELLERLVCCAGEESLVS